MYDLFPVELVAGKLSPPHFDLSITKTALQLRRVADILDANDPDGVVVGKRPATSAN